MNEKLCDTTRVMTSGGHQQEAGAFFFHHSPSQAEEAIYRSKLGLRFILLIRVPGRSIALYQSDLPRQLFLFLGCFLLE